MATLILLCLFSAKAGAIDAPFPGPATATFQILPATPIENTFFGSSILGVTDVDLDGGGDLLVGDPMANNYDGQISVYSGTDGSLINVISSPASSSAFGFCLDSIGDIDGDFINDILVNDFNNVYVLSGSNFTIIHTIDDSILNRSGRTLADTSSINDINSDSVDDIIIGLYGNYSGDGKVLVISGSDGSTIIHEIISPSEALYFGSKVLGATDLNTDSMPDIVICSNEVAYTYSGATGNLLDSLNASSGSYTRSVITINDPVNWGLPNPTNVLVGYSDGIGSIKSYYGGSDICESQWWQGGFPRWADPWQEENVVGGLGASLISLGDISGGGVDDFAAGAPSINFPNAFIYGDPEDDEIGKGRVLFYSGEEILTLYWSGFMGTPNYTDTYSLETVIRCPNEITAGQYGYFFGSNITTIPDVNMDGVPELVVADYGTEVDGYTYAGSLYVYHSSPQGYLTSEDLSLSFEDIVLGATDTGNAILGNSWMGPLELTGAGIFIDGPDAANFKFNIAPDTSNVSFLEKRNIVVEFDPQTGGPKSANLKVTTSENGGTTLTYPLSGKALTVTVSPTSYNFQTVYFPGPSSNHNITVYNHDTSPLYFTGSGFEFTGNNAASFQFLSTPDTSVIPPGGSRTVQVILAPVTNGNQTAQLDITTTDSFDPLLTVNLSGNAAIASPSSLEFAEITPENSPSLSQTITAANWGPASSFSYISINGDDGDQFIFEETPDISVLAQGETREIKVQFSPDSLGYKTAEVNVSLQGGGSATIDLKGNCITVPEHAIYYVADNGIFMYDPDGNSNSYYWITNTDEYNVEINRGGGYTPNDLVYGGIVVEDSDSILVRYSGTAMSYYTEIGIMRIDKFTGDRESVYKVDAYNDSGPDQLWYSDAVGLVCEVSGSVVTFNHEGLVRIDLSMSSSEILKSFPDLSNYYGYNLVLDSTGNILFNVEDSIVRYNLSTSSIEGIWDIYSTYYNSINTFDLESDGSILAIVEVSGYYDLIRISPSGDSIEVIYSQHYSPTVGYGDDWSAWPVAIQMDENGVLSVVEHRPPGGAPIYFNPGMIAFSKVYPENKYKIEMAQWDNISSNHFLPYSPPDYNSPYSFMALESYLPLDTDYDGLLDSVEDNHPNGGDGNKDGIPDSEQLNVASLPDEKGNGDYVTLAGPENTFFTSLSISNEQPATNPPPPNDLLFVADFTLVGLIQGASADIDLYWTESASVSGYYKFKEGYPFGYDFKYIDGYDIGLVSIDNTNKKLTLRFQDGMPYGDFDYMENGEIDDPGGPVMALSSSVDTWELYK